MGLSQFAGSTNSELTDSIIAALAIGKGRFTLARMAMLTEDERQEMLDTVGWE
jgi:hypothetical protein